MKTIEVELPDNIADLLDELARDLDTSPEDIARAGIAEKLDTLREEFRYHTSYLYVVDGTIEGYRSPA